MLSQYSSLENDIRSEVYNKFQCQERKSSASSTASTSSLEYNQKFTEMSRQVLANTLQKNWTDNYCNQTGYDDSLTNLSWLHNVNPIKINEQLSFTPFLGYPKDRISTQNIPLCRNQNQARSSVPTQYQPTVSQDIMPHEQPDYKNNPNLKPPFSYAILISWAMKELGKPKITLSDIYGWIIENFAFYRCADSSWQNSIRHNLSLGKCFEKVPRRKDEPGKGGFWRINPQHNKILEMNLLKIKYNPSNNQITNNRSENSFSGQKITKPIINTNYAIRQCNTIANPIKRCRKSPLTVTQEDWDSLESFNNSQPDYYNYTLQPSLNMTNDGKALIEETSYFTNSYFDLSPFDNSSSDSNNYGPPSDNDVSMNNFNEDSLDEILNSPMLLNKEDLSEHDDFQLITSNNEFSELFATTKDDLQELNCLLGIN